MLTSENVHILTERLKASAGREVCAFLLCNDHEECLLFVPNLAEFRHEFALSPDTLERSMLLAQRQGMRVLTFVHSHVESIQLSNADYRAMSRIPEIPWLIVALQGKQLHGALYSSPGGELVSEWYV